MKLAFLLLSLSAFVANDTNPQLNICLKAEEQKLYELLMDYRKEKGLPEIPLSYSLTKVAKMHTYDLYVNKPSDLYDCNLHSWSDQGKWSPCCYTGDRKSAECMWNKPRELSKYNSDGFEISAWITRMSAENAIQGWKKSSGHNQVMINKGPWRKLKWNAVGVAITGTYAVIWFGKEKDPDQTTVGLCE